MKSIQSEVLKLYEDYLISLYKFDGNAKLEDGTKVKHEIARVEKHIKNLKTRKV